MVHILNYTEFDDDNEEEDMQTGQTIKLYAYTYPYPNAGENYNCTRTQLNDEQESEESEEEEDINIEGIDVELTTTIIHRLAVVTNQRSRQPGLLSISFKDSSTSIHSIT